MRSSDVIGPSHLERDIFGPSKWPV